MATNQPASSGVNIRFKAERESLDRIKLLHQTKKTFEIPEDFDVEEFVRPSFGIYQGSLTRVKIRFSPEVAGYVKESIWHESRPGWSEA